MTTAIIVLIVALVVASIARYAGYKAAEREVTRAYEEAQRHRATAVDPFEDAPLRAGDLPVDRIPTRKEAAWSQQSSRFARETGE